MKKIIILLAMLIFAISCGKNGGSGKTFTLNLTDEPKSIDPQLSTDVLGGTVDDLITEGLTKRGKDGTFVAGLAKSWDKSADGLKWTFHLRDGIKWSNGDPITAQDFKNGWLRALDPQTASQYSYMLYPIKNAEKYNKKAVSAEKVGIKVIDDKTLEVELEAPVPYFDSLVAFKTYMPLNQKFFDKTGDSYFTEANKTMSSGAYTMEKWTHGSEIVFKKNPNYWDADNVKVENIVYKIIPDNNSALNAFNNKEVDVTSITSEQAKGFKDNPKMVSKNDGSVWYLLFNFNNKTLANLKVRKALLMAIDREGLINNVLNGYGTAAKTFVPKGIGITGKDGKDFTEFVPTSTLGYNPQEAKKLLAEGLKEAGQASFPKMSMLINESGNNKVIAEYIQEQLRKNLNIQLDLEIMTAQERFSRMSQKDFDMVFAGWSGDYPDAITYLDLFESTGGNNNGSYKNPEYDALVKTVRSTADQNVRIPALVKIEGIIAQDLPVGVLFHREKQYLVDKKVKGLEFPPHFKLKNFPATISMTSFRNNILRQSV